MSASRAEVPTAFTAALQGRHGDPQQPHGAPPQVVLPATASKPAAAVGSRLILGNGLPKRPLRPLLLLRRQRRLRDGAEVAGDGVRIAVPHPLQLVDLPHPRVVLMMLTGL